MQHRVLHFRCIYMRYVCIAYVNAWQHTSAYAAGRMQERVLCDLLLSLLAEHTSAYVSIRQHTETYVSIRQHTSAYGVLCDLLLSLLALLVQK
jgi:hypothetical protein